LIKILLVDGIPAQIRALDNILKQIGFSTVIHAKSYKEALTAIEKEKDVGLVITEWNLSDKTGLCVLESLREQEETCKIPVLLTFKDKTKDDILAALKKGVKGFLVKPFKLDTVRQKVTEFLVEENGGHDDRNRELEEIIKKAPLE
jgi:two-component system, chemotaxis family, chemotaxis protein CheY